MALLVTVPGKPLSFLGWWTGQLPFDWQPRPRCGRVTTRTCAGSCQSPGRWLCCPDREVHNTLFKDDLNLKCLITYTTRFIRIVDMPHTGRLGTTPVT